MCSVHTQNYIHCIILNILQIGISFSRCKLLFPKSFSFEFWEASSTKTSCRKSNVGHVENRGSHKVEFVGEKIK